MPHTIAPVFAVSSDTLPKDPGKWAFEFKWDGVRAICLWDGQKLRLQSRKKLDITPARRDFLSRRRGAMLFLCKCCRFLMGCRVWIVG